LAASSSTSAARRLLLAADVDDRQWSTAAFLEPYREHATRVRIAERENKPLALRWTTP
jgi:hypothetical protein